MAAALRTPARAPGALPLVGHLPSFIKEPMDFMQSMRRHGDVVIIKLGPSDAYVLNSPELIDLMLVQRSDDFQRGRLFEMARHMWGNGLIATDGDFHRGQRRLAQPAFHPERLRRYSVFMRAEADAMVSCWRHGEVVDIRSTLHQLTCPALTRSLFSYSIDDDRVSEITAAMATLLKGVFARTLLPDAVGRLPLPGNRDFNRAKARLHSSVREIIADYVSHRDEDRGDLLSALVAARDTGTGSVMSDAQLHDEVKTLLIAGTETATTTLCWLFYELDRHPDLYARHLAEVDSVLQGRPVEADDIPKLEFTAALINEALRLYTPNWLLMRKTKKPIRFTGVDIPAGAEIVYSLTAMHRDEALFEDALAFNPDRWQKKIDKTTCIPFGAGRHKCIGDRFAIMEMVIFLATISSRFRLVGLPGQTMRVVKSAALLPGRQKMITVSRGLTYR
jgi:cytochrome P450